jgi:hypothetical protein
MLNSLDYGSDTYLDNENLLSTIEYNSDCANGKKSYIYILGGVTDTTGEAQVGNPNYFSGIIFLRKN